MVRIACLSLLASSVALLGCGGATRPSAADTFVGSTVPDASPTFDLPRPRDTTADGASGEDGALVGDGASTDGDGTTSADASADAAAPGDSSVDAAPPDSAAADAPKPAPSWSVLPGNGLTVGRPAAVMRKGQIYLFVVGTSGETWQNIRVTGSVWSGWSKMPADLPLTDHGPVATLSSGGTIDLFVRARGGTLYAKRRGVTSWAKAAALSGVTATQAPAAYYDTDSKLHVLAVDSLSRIYEAVRGSSTFSGWSALSLSGAPSIAGAPAAVVDKSNILRLFVRDGSGAIWQASRVGQTWLSFKVLDNVGRSPQSPTATLDSSGSVRLYVRGMDDKLWSNRRLGSGWRGWQSHGGQLASAPAVLLDGNFVRAFSRGGSNSIETCYPL